MNDAIRELLSAYLDGALPELERRDVEERLSRSEELRAELESLRAVSNAVKGLPRAKLPGGFQARLQARLLREGGSATEREWWILPPAFRPAAFALSSAIVAFVVWDKAHPPAENARTLWDGVDNVALDRVAVKSAAQAPSSLDLTGAVAGGASPDSSDGLAKKEDAADKGVSPAGRRAAAPGKPLEFQESDLAAVRGAAAPRAVGELGAGAAGQPAAPTAAVPSAPAPVAPAEGVFQARTEEERSAMNERLYQNFEQEKKRMGIAQIIEKDAKDDDGSAGGARFAALSAAPEPRARAEAKAAPRRQYGVIAGASARKLSKAKAAPSPEDAPAAAVPAFRGLALKTPDALAAAWAGAGLAGDPPPVDFPAQMAIFLAGPSGGGIVEVQERKKFIVVLYKESGFTDPYSRVRAVTASKKPIVVKPAD